MPSHIIQPGEAGAQLLAANDRDQALEFLGKVGGGGLTADVANSFALAAAGSWYPATGVWSFAGQYFTVAGTVFTYTGPDTRSFIVLGDGAARSSVAGAYDIGQSVNGAAPSPETIRAPAARIGGNAASFSYFTSVELDPADTVSLVFRGAATPGNVTLEPGYSMILAAI